MTWFKSLIMRQNSPLLLINSGAERSCSHKDQSSSLRRQLNKELSNKQQVRNKKVSSRLAHNTSHLAIIGFPLESQSQELSRLPHLVPREDLESEEDSLMSKQLINTSCQQQQQQEQEEFSRGRTSNLFGLKWATSHKLINNHQCNKQQSTRSKINSHKSSLPERSRRKMSLVMSTWLLSLALALCLIGTFSSLASSSSVIQLIDVQPENQLLVNNGQDQRIRCFIRNRQGDCIWLRNGRSIGQINRKYLYVRQPEDGDCSIMIKNVTVQQDDGMWQCQVTSPELDQESLVSRESQLVVLVPPERPQIKNMSQNTQRLILEENKTKYVFCEIRGGNPAPQIEWLLDNKNISKEAQTSSLPVTLIGNTSQRIVQSKLKMSDIKRSMNGKNLTCVGVHQTLNQSTSVELDVQYVPTVSVGQREFSIVEGSPLSIHCQVDSNPPPNLINWRLVSDGSQAALSSQMRAQSANSIAPTRPGPVLEFDRISRDFNQNVFECLAQNSYGISLPADVKINVLYAPFLLNTSHSESVVVGSQAQLACVFDGNPEPEVKWFYTDPLSRSAMTVQLDNNKQQYLPIKNVTYRNEGDYHCEAKNQINGVFYGVRSSNIILDVYGEPQFLVKSPQSAKAVQGSKSDISLTFCSDPPPNKVYWQFGSIRLDVRLTNLNGGSALQSPPGGGSKQHAVSQRFQVHQLQALQKRDSTFSKSPTCFEAQLSILEPELTDQRDYTLVVHNERGHQSALVRLRVSSPLSPVVMITAAFVTICALFLLSLAVMFLVKKRHQLATGDDSNANQANGGQSNGQRQMEKKGVEHLKNGNSVQAAALAAAAAANGQLMQQTRGIVNGAANGLANGASNPNNALNDDAKLHLMSMASSDTSGDQRQLLANSDRNSSGSNSSANQCADFITHSPTHSTARSSTDSSTPIPMNHISVEEPEEEEEEERRSELDGSYQAGESVLTQLSPHKSHHLANNGALIYANLDYTNLEHHSLADQNSNNANEQTPISQQQKVAQRRQATPMESPSDLSLAEMQLSANEQLSSPKSNAMRSSVGATIAMMNSLAAQNNQQVSSPGAGVLNGAINQQLAQSRQIRKPGPPKPPKPSIQQRSRFYQQHVANGNNNNGLVMIGSPTAHQNLGYQSSELGGPDEPSANELAIEYSRIAFPARAEL